MKKSLQTIGCTLVLGATASSGCSEEQQPRSAVVSQVTAEALSGGTLAVNIQRHIETLAQAPRALGTLQLAAARDYCADQLAALGYKVSRQSFGLGDHAGQNVIGTLSGQQLANEQILLSAHIDSVKDCNGADDNASGIAGVLSQTPKTSRSQARQSFCSSCSSPTNTRNTTAPIVAATSSHWSRTQAATSTAKERRI